MASTNKTTHYDLSQYVGSDKPTYLGDYNTDMTKIDTAINSAQTKADSADLAATTAQTTAETAQTTANTAVTNAATAQSGVNTNAASIGTLANLTTSDKASLVNAVNEVKGNATTNAGAISSLQEQIYDLEEELLWTNSSPDSAFPTQTINFNDTYDEYEIFYQAAATYGKYKEIRVKPGFSYDLESIIDSAFRSRGITAGTNFILFGTGVFSLTLGGGDPNDYQCVPYMIYGIKHSTHIN